MKKMNRWSTFTNFFLLFLLFLTSCGGTQSQKGTLSTTTEIPDDSSFSEASVEIPGLRTASSITYENKDGSRTTEFSSAPVYYLKGDAWQDIDTTLSSDIEDDDFDLGVEKSELKVFFKDTASNANFITRALNLDTDTSPYVMKFMAGESALLWQSEKMSIVDKDEKALYEENAVRAERKNSENQISYVNVFQNVDENYIVLPESIKHNVILKQKFDDFSDASKVLHTGTLSLPPEFEVMADETYLQPEESVEAKSFKIKKDGTEKWYYFSAPSMFEQDGDEEIQGTYKLERTREALRISIQFDYAWIQDAKRIFPLVLDPSVTLESSTASRTGYIYGNAGSKTRSYSSSVGMKIGGANGNVNYYRGYAEWDISAIADATSISSAIVRLRDRVWNDVSGDGSMSTKIIEMSLRPTSSTPQQVYDDISDGRDYGYIQWFGKNTTKDFTFDATERSHVFNKRGLGWFAIGLRLYNGVGDDADSVWLHTNTTSSTYRPKLIVTYAAPTDGASFVTETIPDGTDLEVNTNFTKTWTLRNSGQTTWNNTYCLHYASDNVAGTLSTSQNPVCVQGTVAPGNNYIFSVSMRTPASAQANAREDWSFKRNGTTIQVSASNTVYVLIDVTAPAPFPAPGLVSPANGATAISRTARLDWNSINGATNYRVQVSTSSAFNSFLIDHADGNSYYDMQQNDNLQRNTLYYWRARAGSADRGGEWSVTRNFRTENLTASFVSETYPDNNVDGADVLANTNFTKTWTIQNTGNSTWTSSHCIHFLGTNVPGGNPLSQNTNATCIVGSVAPNNNYTFSVPMRTPASGTGLRDRWQLRDGFNQSILVDGSNEIWALIDVIADPCGTAGASLTVTSPNGGENLRIGNNYTVTWNEVGNIQQLHIHLYKGANVVYGLSNNAPNNGSFNFSLQADTVPGNDYRIGMSNLHANGACDGTIYDFSNNNFTVSAAPSAPVLTAPANAVSNVSRTVRLDWNAASGATSYRVQASTTNNFSALVVNELTPSNQTHFDVPANRFSYDTQYYWRARGEDALSAGAWSATRNFTTEQELQLTAALESESHQDGTSVNPRQNFTKRWTLRNNGEVTWNSNYVLRYVSGPMSNSHVDIPLGTNVAPNQTKSFYVSMTAPLSGQNIQDDWQLRSDTGGVVPVGGSQTVWARVNVAANDSAEWVGETIPDDSAPFTPGQSFTKTWTIKNRSSVAWNSDYFLRRRAVVTELSQQNTLPISGSVAVGSNFVFSVNMRAPQQAGTYREEWELVGPSGSVIQIRGADNSWSTDKIWANISVAVPETPPDGLPTTNSSNPTYAEINQELLAQAAAHNIPPNILQTVAFQESKWRQFRDSNSSGLFHCGTALPWSAGDIVYGYDFNPNDCPNIISVGIGLMQITIPVTNTVNNIQNGINWGDATLHQQVSGNWRTNIEKAIEKLNARWMENIDYPGAAGCDIDKRVIENWYYPIAWYNGQGGIDGAYGYVRDIYSYMRGDTFTNAHVSPYLTTLANIGSPQDIPGYSEVIFENGNQPYSLAELVDNGGRIHRWTGGNNYNDVTDLVSSGNCESGTANNLSIPSQVKGLTLTQNGGTVNFEWNENPQDETVQGYYLYTQTVDANGTPQGNEVRFGPIQGSGVSQNLAAGRYRFQVAALNAAGTGTRSKSYLFSVEAVQAGLAQVQGVTTDVDDHDVRITWNAVGNANKYLLVWKTTGFAGIPLTGSAETDSTTYSKENASEGSFRIQVKACKEAPWYDVFTKDECGAWSDEIQFNVPEANFDIACTELHNNNMVMSKRIAVNDINNYCFKLPANVDVVTVQMGGKGLVYPKDADLYLKQGSPIAANEIGPRLPCPDPDVKKRDTDCYRDSINPIFIAPAHGSSFESVTLYNPPAGKYYVAVHGSSSMNRIVGDDKSLNYFIKLHYHGVAREGLPNGFVLNRNGPSNVFSPVNPDAGDWWSVERTCASNWQLAQDAGWGPCNPTVTINGSSGIGVVTATQAGQNNLSCYSNCRSNHHDKGDWDSRDFNLSDGTDNGENLYAALSGTVIFKGSNGGYGQEVVIQSDIDANFAVRYAHMKSWANNLEVGQHIDAGTLIGQIGGTGGYKPHLHFNLHKNIALNTASGTPMNQEGLNTSLRGGMHSSTFYSAFVPLDINDYLDLPSNGSKTWTIVESRCPVDLSVTDSQGRKVGKGAFGTMDLEIPEVEYYTVHAGVDEYELLALPNVNVGNDYQVNIVGAGDGEFNVAISSPDAPPQHIDNLAYLGERVSPEISAKLNIASLNSSRPLMIQNENGAYIPELNFDEDDAAQYNAPAPQIENISSRVLSRGGSLIITGTNLGGLANALSGEVDLIQNHDIYRPFKIQSWQQNQIVLDFEVDVPFGEYQLRLMVYPSRLLSNKIVVDVIDGASTPVLEKLSTPYALADRDGNRLELSGRNFAGAASVRIGNQNLQDTYVASQGFIHGTLPRFAVGTYNVVVNNGNGRQSAQIHQIQYIDPNGDLDSDGILNQVELLNGTNPGNIDTDGDGVKDGVDDLPTDESESVDTDGDGIGNNADTDDDNDGVNDTQDLCPLVSDPNQSNVDGDAAGDVCDEDADNDGVLNQLDAFPLNANESLDTDEDGIGNNADLDDDNDGVNDAQDAFPYNSNETADTDGDGIGNNADTDRDNDGVDNVNDAFPLDPNESADTDNDGIGDNVDLCADTQGLAGADGCAANQSPLLIDGSMEAANLDAWPASGNPVVREKTNAEAESGVQSLHLSTVGAANAGVRQNNIPVEAGKWYEFSFSYQLLQGQIKPVLVTSGSADFEGLLPLISNTENGWQTYTRQFQIPLNFVGELGVLITAVNADVYLDEINIRSIPGPRLVLDGNMEEEGVGAWNSYGSPAQKLKTAEKSLSGVQSLYLDTEGAGGGVQQLDIPLEAGEWYEYSFHYQLQQGEIRTLLGINSSNIDFENALAIITNQSNTWQTYTRQFQVPADYAGGLRFVINTKNARVYLDDVSITPIAGPDIVLDGNMEAVGVGSWSSYGSPATKEKTAVEFADGQHSLHISTLGSAGGVQQLDLPVEAGQWYEYSFQYLMKKGEIKPLLGINSSNTDFEGNGAVLRDQSGTWKSYVRQFQVPAGFAGGLRLVINTRDADLYLDAVRIIPIANPLTILDGDMESDTLSAWQAYASPALLEKVSDSVHGGSRSLYIQTPDATGRNQGGVQQLQVNVEPGRRYRFSFWYKSHGMSLPRLGAGDSNNDFEFVGWDENGQPLYPVFTRSAAGWTYYEREFIAPDTDDFRAVFIVYDGEVSLDGQSYIEYEFGQLWLDDVQITPLN